MGKKGKAAARERREQRRQEVTLLRAVPYETGQRWWDGLSPARAVAVVTGANRGIGYEISRQLALHGLHVVLASRDAARGQEAAERLLREEAVAQPSVEWQQLDVTDAASVEAFAAWTAETHGGIHVLVSSFCTSCFVSSIL
jgi:short-subunit dehydrogenase